MRERGIVSEKITSQDHAVSEPIPAQGHIIYNSKGVLRLKSHSRGGRRAGWAIWSTGTFPGGLAAF